VLNAIVEVKVSQVEGVPLVIFLQHSDSKVGHEEADSWREIEGSIHLAWEFTKLDVFTVVWEDT
jgi:hypothetical protein